MKEPQRNPLASALFLMLPRAPHSPASQCCVSWVQGSPCFDLFSALLSAFHPGHQTPSRAKSPTSVCFLHRFPWGRSHPDSRAPGSREVKMYCVPKKGHIYVFWYQQILTKEFKFLISFQNDKVLDDKEMPKRFSAECPSNSPCSLKIQPTEPQDSAMYFCASSDCTVRNTG